MCWVARLPHTKEIFSNAFMVIEVFFINSSYGWLSEKAAKWTGKDLPTEYGDPDSAGARKMMAMREVEMWKLDKLDRDL